MMPTRLRGDYLRMFEAENLTKMNSKVKKWIEEDGEKFLRILGIKKGQAVLDFGCGVGRYTIPLAMVVGKEGTIYAFDKSRQKLNRLKEFVDEEDLKNVKLMEGQTMVPLEDNSIDAVLCYDAIHYEKNRKIIYEEVRRLLKPAGFFSLYPKHCKTDFPLMELAYMDLEDIIKEVKRSGLLLKNTMTGECLHDNYYNKCNILNFKKG